jgi:hypothetical protein
VSKENVVLERFTVAKNSSFTRKTPSLLARSPSLFPFIFCSTLVHLDSKLDRHTFGTAFALHNELARSVFDLGCLKRFDGNSELAATPTRMYKDCLIVVGRKEGKVHDA